MGSTGGKKIRFREKTSLFKHFMNKKESSTEHFKDGRADVLLYWWLNIIKTNCLGDWKYRHADCKADKSQRKAGRNVTVGWGRGSVCVFLRFRGYI